jgi:hypothetical protein
MFSFRIRKTLLDSNYWTEDWIAKRIALIIEGEGTEVSVKSEHYWQLGRGNNWWLRRIRECHFSLTEHTYVECYLYVVTSRYPQGEQFLTSFKNVIVKFLDLRDVNPSTDLVYIDPLTEKPTL